MKGVRYIIGCLLLWLVACQQHEVVEPMEEPVELTFKLDLADGDSRALVDGDYLDLVSVYIVDGNKNIVASQENIPVANNATEVEVTFGKSYNLKRGLHTLMAVANHRTLTFTKNDYAALMGNQVHSTDGTDNISPKTEVQPLSLMKEIELHAGNNQIEGELMRTFARFRIEVKNNSGSFPLKINSLTFSDNFTQKQAYVFDDGTDRKYFGTKGAPVSTSSNAKVAFPNAGKTIEAQQSAVLFDAYLLESKAAEDEKYTYTLDLEYEAESSVESELGRVDAIKANYENSYFLIKNTRSGKFMYRNNNNEVFQSNQELNFLKAQIQQGSYENYLWKLEKASNTNHHYYISNSWNSQRYIGNPGNQGDVAVQLYENKGAGFVFENFDNNGVIMKYYNTTNHYLNDNSNNQSNAFICGWGTKNDPGNAFVFYVVQNSLKHDTPIVLTTIDPISQQSSPTKAIKRNDFINVLVTVSYNPVAGKFEFVVQDWDNGGGNVEFN